MAIATGDPTPLLLDGVTGGGKTAVYAEAIAASLDAGRPALVLVPEIALAMPLVDRLRADLGAEVAIVHSALGEGERADEWRRIRAGAVDVVVGTRLAVLAPLADVGLVVVDEEHEATYKSDRTPRLQARDAAIRLAELAGAAVVLGSATPSVETVGRVRDGSYHRVRLPDPTDRPPAGRRARRPPGGARGRQSRAALGQARRALAGPRPSSAGERAILVINRRGAASAVLCRDCGHVQACPECARPLVFHQAGLHAPLPPLRGGRPAGDALSRLSARRGSGTLAAAPSGSSARSASASRGCASGGSTATSSSVAGRPSGSSTPSRRARSTSSSARSLVTKGLDIPRGDARRGRLRRHRAQSAR